MIRICTSLAKNYEVELWGRKKSKESVEQKDYVQRRFSFLVNKGMTFYLLYNLKMFVHLLFARFDILHAVDLDTLPAGYAVCKLRRKKLVYDAHEFFTEVPELIDRPSKRAIWLRLEQAILPKVKNAITVSKTIADAYTTLYSVPFTVIRNVPTAKALEPINAELKPYLLYQGALNKGRGLEATIRAMENLPINLIIAGSGDLDQELRALVSELQLDQKVSFLGFISPSELPALTAGAYAGINIAENLGLSYYYSLNNKFFDYIQAGVPAITMPFPEYLLLESECQCGVFATATSQDIERAVNLLLTDTPLYNKLRKNCLLARKVRTWNKEEERLIDFYAKIA
jgi:glycosyltransferase involved in cell wall biosynthesis